MSTETTRRALSHEALRAGKARVAYRVSARDRHSHATSSSDVPRHVARVERAITFASEGRHAAAERLLRDAAGALARRSAHREEGAALIALGRLLLERGRAGDAEALYRDGGARLPVEDDAGRVSAGLWAIAASIDADRLLEAESRCQKLLKGPMLSPGQRVWAQALLADVFLWQGRVDEAVRLDLPLIEEGEGLDLETVATVNATAVNVLLTAGRVFEAGQRARVGLDRAGTSSSSPRLRLIAETAHLRLLVATGDLALARVTFSRVGDLARTAHAPVRLAHARLIWHEALQRGKAVSEAARELRRLSRARRALPTLLRRVVDQRVAGSTGRGPAAPVCIRLAAEAIPASRLIWLAFEEDDDLAAARLVLDHVVTATRACRVDLRSNPGANRPLLALAGGAPTRAGERTSRWGGRSRTK